MEFPVVGPAGSTGLSNDAGHGNPAAAAVTPPSPRVNASVQAATPVPVMTQGSLSAKIESLKAQKAELEPLHAEYHRVCDAYGSAVQALSQLEHQLLEPMMYQDQDVITVVTARDTLQGDLAGALQLAIKLGMPAERSDEFKAMRRDVEESRREIVQFNTQHPNFMMGYMKIEDDLQQAQNKLAERDATAGVVTFHQGI